MEGLVMQLVLAGSDVPDQPPVLGQRQQLPDEKDDHEQTCRDEHGVRTEPGEHPVGRQQAGQPERQVGRPQQRLPDG